MKKLITILTLILLTSCQSYSQKEAEKTHKAKSASSRINDSEKNSRDNLQDLDE